MGQDEQSIDSVYDFLYVDRARIGIFLSQLQGENRGHLTKITAEEQTGGDVTGTVGFNVGAAGNLATKSSHGNRQLREFDPQWLHARTFLDVFDENGMLVRGSGPLRLDELRLFSGALSIRDMRLMRPVWSAIVDAVGENEFLKALKRQGPQAKPLAVAIKKAMKGFLENLPQTITGTLKTDEHKVWFTLTPEALLVTIEELFMKFGVTLPGAWNVVAVVDAIEPPSLDADDAMNQAQGVEAATEVLFQQMGGQFGRPSDTVAVTPILVFREISS